MCIFFLSQTTLGKVESLSIYCWTLPSRWTLEWVDLGSGHRLWSLWGGWRCMCVSVVGGFIKGQTSGFSTTLGNWAGGVPCGTSEEPTHTPLECISMWLSPHTDHFVDRGGLQTAQTGIRSCAAPLHWCHIPYVDPRGATSSKLVQGAVNKIGEINREGHGSLPTPGHGDGAGGEKLWVGWVWIWDH